MASRYNWFNLPAELGNLIQNLLLLRKAAVDDIFSRLPSFLRSGKQIATEERLISTALIKRAKFTGIAMPMNNQVKLNKRIVS